MNTLRIKPAMRYQLNYMFWASLISFAIMTAVLIIVVFFSTTIRIDEVEQTIVNLGVVDFAFESEMIVNFNIGGVLIIMLFIVGVGGTREDLRFFIQHGIGRKACFLSTLFSSLIVGAVYALVCELLNLAFINLALFPVSGFHHSDIGFFGGWLLHTLTFFIAWQLGALISLIYYRLNKIGKVIFSVAAVATLSFGIPRFIDHLIGFVFSGDVDGTAFAEFFANPLNTIPITLAFSVVFALGNFLLIRRANVKD